MSERAAILVIGIGNILMRDDGVGVHVVRRLGELDLPAGVELVDGGTAGADLLDIISDRSKVVFVDAIDAGKEAGTIMRLSVDDLAASTGAVSLHEFGIVETLLMAEQLGCEPKEVVVLAVQSKDVSCGMEMSAELVGVVEDVVGKVLEEIETK